jgi:Adenylate cyclase, class 2 (thermophilic)
MKTEIEAKWLDIDHAEMAKRLENLGGRLVMKKTPMIRTVFDTGTKNSFVRVRDEGDKITLTYKKVEDENSLTGTKEICLEVSSYDEAVEFMKAIGLQSKSIEETKREVWELDGAEIALDEWPWLPPFMEIETPNEAMMTAVVAKLGLDMIDAMYSSADLVYAHYYDVTPDEVVAHKGFWREIRFGAVPKELEAKRKIK